MMKKLSLIISILYSLIPVNELSSAPGRRLTKKLRQESEEADSQLAPQAGTSRVSTRSKRARDHEEADGKKQALARILVLAQQASGYYRSQRIRNMYDPEDSKQFKLSRSKLGDYFRCRRCFYFDRKLGVAQPPGYPLSLNGAVDELLKKEFDRYRELEQPHPLCIENKINAIPFKHKDIDKWRDALHGGLQYKVPGTNITVTGAPDDIWVDQATGQLIVVDVKATANSIDEVESLEALWKAGYQRQVEVYQWLLSKNNFDVSPRAYFLYCDARVDVGSFDNKLDFTMKLVPYDGDSSWVEPRVMEAYECLQSEDFPSSNKDCRHCSYVEQVKEYM